MADQVLHLLGAERFVLRPRFYLRLGLASAVLAHATAILMVVAAALPSLQGTRTILPPVRLFLVGTGAVACFGLIILAGTHRMAWSRAIVGASIVGTLVFTGMLYGCSKSASVTPRPIATAEVGGRAAFDHVAFDRVLEKFVDAHGMVDYRGLLAQRTLLDEYVGQLATASPRSHPALFPTKEHELAYWFNAYNALAIRAVLDHYPIASVKDIMVAYGVFSRLTFPVGGTPMTLDDIEKGILLKEFDDPRVHFALTCASMSCPRLDRRAFTAERLSERLDEEGRDFLRSRDGVQIDATTGTVRLSRYFEWYGRDFGTDHLAYVRPFLSKAQVDALARIRQPAIQHMDYDWRLNDQGASWRAR